MYLSFYGLQKKPFQINTDPSFLWLGEKHEEALAILKYGILENQGFILLTGDVGTGKTTLINALLNSLDDEVIVARIPDPGMETIDFMNYVSNAFEMKKKFSSKDAFLIHFGHFLNSVHAAGKKTLLIIDEAQRLRDDLLEEIRQLSNIEKQDTKLLNIFFVGQNEFNDVLLENKNRALRQRITINYEIEPLVLHETGEFIRHRLKVAGAENDIFSPDAIDKVFEFSGGFPRRINIICDHCLLSGFVMRKNNVTGEMVEECAKDLLLPGSSKNSSSESQETVSPADSDDSENLQQFLADDPQEVSSRRGWRTVSIVVLIVISLFIVTYIKYPGEYRSFFSRADNNEMKVSSGERGANTLIANSNPEPDKDKVLAEGLDTVPEAVTGESDQEESVVQEPFGENVEPGPVTLEEDRSENQNLGPTSVIPDMPDEDTGIPAKGKDAIATSILDSTQGESPADLDQQKQLSEEVKQEDPTISETDVIEKMETGTDFDEDEKAGVIGNQEKPVPDFESPENAVKETEPDELPENQFFGENQEEAAEPEIGDAAISKDNEEEVEATINVIPINVVVKDESEVVLKETPSEPGRVETIPETDRVEQPVVIFEVADTQPVQPYSVDQQNQTNDEVTEENQPVSEPGEIQRSEINPDQDDQESVEAVLTSEIQDQISDLADVEVQTASGVTDTMASDVSGETGAEIVETPEIYADEEREIEEDVEQAIINDQLLEPAVPADLAEPVDSAEDNEVLTEESEGPDPGALIDWVIKKRSD